MPKCQDEQDFCAYMTWGNMGVQLFWVPVITQVCMALLMPGIGTAYRKLIGWSKARGSAAEIEKWQVSLTVIAILEGVLSLVQTCIWVVRTYNHKVYGGFRVFEMLSAAFFIFNYFLGAARSRFSQKYVWRLDPIIDVVSVSSQIASPIADKASWIGWGHLRVFRALVAFDKILMLTGLQDIGELTIKLIHTLLKSASVVTALAGTVLMLEVLGDPDFIADRERVITTDMGDLSFIQMVYWIFTTMSTVGYGDFSPTTLLSRMFIVFTIVYGVILFSTEIKNMLTLKGIQARGLGRYKPVRKGIKEIVVLGGGVSYPSAILVSFLKELFHPDHVEDETGEGWPACNMMSIVSYPEILKNMVSGMPDECQIRIKYFIGNPMITADLKRLSVSKAECVLVLPNFSADDRAKEDDKNVLRALSVQRAYPNVRLILATILPKSVTKAVSVGLSPGRCLSIDEWTSCLFSQSCLCRGWIVFITNLMTSSTDQVARDSDEPWLREYMHGYNQEVHAFCLSKFFKGTAYPGLVEQALGHGIQLFAVKLHGRIVLNPVKYIFQGLEVIYALSPDKETLKVLSDPDTELTDASFNQVNTNARKSRMSLAIGKKAPEGPMGLQRDSDIQLISKKARAAKAIISGSYNLADVDYAEYDARSEKIAKHGGHYVLVLLAHNIWQRVQAFMSLLRNPRLSFKVPIIVLTPPPGPDAVIVREIFGSDVTCSFLIGSAERISDLKRAGVCESRTIAIFASQQEKTDLRMVDSASVISLTCVETYLYENAAQVPILCELTHADNFQLLTNRPNINTASSQRLLNPEAEKEAEKSTAVLADIFYRHPRFATGGIFSVGVLGALLAQRYYTPGVLEVMAALITGEDQESIPWQIVMPEEYVGCRYGELVIRMSRDPWNATCLGLYRAMRPNDSTSMKFMVTNPDEGTLLDADDFILVLGDIEFGKLCLQKDLLTAVRNKAVGDRYVTTPRKAALQAAEAPARAPAVGNPQKAT